MLLYIFLLAAIVLIILAIVKLGSIALQFTGMEPGMAMFQSLSAFTNTGFTTRAAEAVVNHRKRRMIVSILMIIGHIGIVSVVVTLVHSFASETGSWVPVLRRMVFILLGIYAAYFIFIYSPPGRRVGRWFARYREQKNRAAEA